MTNSTRNLGYQFYFLFRTRWWKDDQFIQEPYSPGQFGSLGTIGIQIDSDKRLFCRTVPPGKIPLINWPTYLKTSWQNILQTYAKAFHSQNAKAGLKEAQEFCADNLLGVVLLITDASLESHEVVVDLYYPPSDQSRSISFSYDETVLFSIKDKQNQMPAPATFHPDC